MLEAVVNDTIFENFDAEAGALWGHNLVRLRHRLHSDLAFSDERLGAFLDNIPDDQFTLTTMGEGHDRRSWAHCTRGDLTGAELIRAVSQGRIWINISSINRLSDTFDDMLSRMFSEIKVHARDLDIVKASMGLLVSSPNARVFYHIDVPGQSLWQIRGEKRLYVYPNTRPFLDPADLENVVRRRQEEELHYEPWFDKHATIVDLKAGDMVHWPLNGPHRVENGNCLNISLTTEHWTPAINRHINVQYGNGILRDAGIPPRNAALYGPSALFKAGLSKAWWLSGQQKRQRFRPTLKYRLDSRTPGLLVPIDAPSRADNDHLIAAE
jgi:hypothetical protein